MTYKLNRRNMLAVHAASTKRKEWERLQYDAVHVTKAGTIGTDGERLIRISLPKGASVPETGTITPRMCRELSKSLAEDAQPLPSALVSEVPDDTNIPKFERVFSTLPKIPVAEVICNAKLLADILKAAAAFSDSEHKAVRLRLYGKGQVLRIDAKPTEDGQEFTGLLMPLRLHPSTFGDTETGADTDGNGNRSAESQAELLITTDTGRKFRTDDHL